jgi:cell wall-associated NlpC family hydrolase
MLMLEYARLFNGVAYKWGGDNPLTGFDCSGFIQWVLRSEGLDPSGRQNAQALYNHFLNTGKVLLTPEPGALLFFGRDKSRLTHVAIALNQSRMIHAASGDCTTTDITKAAKQNACVREDQICYRSDLVAVLLPKYL